MLSLGAIQWIAAGAGVVAVPVVSLFKNRGWDKKVKFFWASVVSIVASLGVSIPLDVTDAGTVHYGAIGATTLATAQVVYKLLFEGTRVEDKLTDTLVKPKHVE